MSAIGSIIVSSQASAPPRLAGVPEGFDRAFRLESVSLDYPFVQWISRSLATGVGSTPRSGSLCQILAVRLIRGQVHLLRPRGRRRSQYHEGREDSQSDDPGGDQIGQVVPAGQGDRQWMTI